MHRKVLFLIIVCFTQPVLVVNALTCAGALATKLSHTKTNLSIILVFCVGKAPSSTNSCGIHIAVDNFFSGLFRAQNFIAKDGYLD